MKIEVKFLFFYFWIFVTYMVYRAHAHLFEQNSTLFLVVSYLPIIYFYARKPYIWLVLAAGGIILTALVSNGFASEIIAEQTYIWIVISLIHLCYKLYTR